MDKAIGKVIFLNGPSSSGKSSIAKSLQSKLREPYLHIGIDQIIEMMPEHINNWTGAKAEDGFWWKEGRDENDHIIQQIQLGPYAVKISQLFKNIVATILNDGVNIIIDEICVGDHSSIADWKNHLASYEVLYVGVNASVETLEQREQSRGDRIPGSARAQWLAMKDETDYDVTLDTDKLTVDECVNLILNHI
jgi:chloramphenicol 3-O phosphotransferase